MQDQTISLPQAANVKQGELSERNIATYISSDLGWSMREPETGSFDIM